jgi:hypothetical protein
MDRLRTGEPVWDLAFDEKGRLTAPPREAVLDEVIGEGVADLFVFSHGWGTSERSARELYNVMFPLIRDAASSTAGLGSVGFAGVYWPSLWFPDTPATPPRPAGSTQAGEGAEEEASAGTAALSGSVIAESLRPGFEDPAQQETVTELGRLIDEGTAGIVSGESDAVQQERLVRFHDLLKSLVPSALDGEYEDSGETALLLTGDPREDYQKVADVFGSAPSGSATQGIGDWFGKAVAGMKDALRVLSYTVMKARAGDIGRAGLGPLLADLHGRSPAVRVHLIGHSFGARLVSFALSGVGAPADSPVASLLLLQGAFSHWSFAHAQDNPFGKAGALHTWADRVRGPLVATFSAHDWAVCRWYPKASFLARQDEAGADGGRWDGMGADAFQAVTPSADRSMPAEGDMDYGFTPGTFFRVDAAHVINNVQDQAFAGAHSDIRKPAVAQLAVAAAAAHA